jgi:DNA-binding NtrC family response regulator
MMSAGSHETASKHQMEALAYLHDNLKYLPGWLGRLTPLQMEQLAALLARWRETDRESRPMRSLEKTKKEEFVRALIACNGDVVAAAATLGIGKSTFYRWLKKWGFTACDWRMVYQSAAFAVPFRFPLHAEERAEPLSGDPSLAVVSRTEGR